MLRSADAERHIVGKLCTVQVLSKKGKKNELIRLSFNLTRGLSFRIHTKKEENHLDWTVASGVSTNEVTTENFLLLLKNGHYSSTGYPFWKTDHAQQHVEFWKKWAKLNPYT